MPARRRRRAVRDCPAPVHVRLRRHLRDDGRSHDRVDRSPARALRRSRAGGRRPLRGADDPGLIVGNPASFARRVLLPVRSRLAGRRPATMTDAATGDAGRHGPATGTGSAADTGTDAEADTGTGSAASRAAPVMPLVPVGRTGLLLTRLVFGGAPIGGMFSAVSDDAALETLEA